MDRGIIQKKRPVNFEINTEMKKQHKKECKTPSTDNEHLTLFSDVIDVLKKMDMYDDFISVLIKMA